MASPPTPPSSPPKSSEVVISEIDAALNTSEEVSDAVHTEQQPSSEVVDASNVEQPLHGNKSVEGVSAEPLPTVDEIIEDQIGLVGKVIGDVVASVEAVFGSKPVDDGSNRQESEEVHDSLVMSETRSQSVDATEPVTQEEDVPYQLAAEKERIAEKIQRAKERKKKAVEDDKVAEVSGSIPIPEAFAPVGDPVASVPRAPMKERATVRKFKQSTLANARRSPQVLSAAAPSERSTRQSPRVLAMQKASPSSAKAAPISRRKNTIEKGNDPDAKGKQEAAKGKKSVGQGKQVPAGKVKKSSPEAKKVVCFKKDQDYVEEHNAGDEAAEQDTEYKYVRRSKKRKRGAKGSSDAPAEKKERFNTTARCSLKELAMCIALLKDCHLAELAKVGLAHLKDFKIKENINLRLICFLMYHINPATMTLDLGDGNKILQIRADGIHKLFGLSRGKNSPPRPSDSGHDHALMALNVELGIPRNKHINIDGLRKQL